MKLPRGTVVLVDLNPTVGHEQRGTRPGILVSAPRINVDQRFPLICIVPITGTPGRGALYPPLTPGSSGLRKLSYALVDQLRSIDKRRVRRIFGQIEPLEQEAIDNGLKQFLGLGHRPMR